MESILELANQGINTTLEFLGPTIRETYRTLTDEQKELLEKVVAGTRNNPLDEEQIALFSYFMRECSSGSMTKKSRRGKSGGRVEEKEGI